MTQEEIFPMPHHTIPVRPRTLRRALACTAFGAVLAATGLAWAADAHASPEGDYLNTLRNAGMVIYNNAPQAIATGYRICAAFNVANGEDIAWQIYSSTSYADVPDIATARAWVVAAGTTLCPQHFHPERLDAHQVVA